VCVYMPYIRIFMLYMCYVFHKVLLKDVQIRVFVCVAYTYCTYSVQNKVLLLTIMLSSINNFITREEFSLLKKTHKHVNL
jgi:hypothetical protein